MRYGASCTLVRGSQFVTFTVLLNQNGSLAGRLRVSEWYSYGYDMPTLAARRYWQRLLRDGYVRAPAENTEPYVA